MRQGLEARIKRNRRRRGGKSEEGEREGGRSRNVRSNELSTRKERETYSFRILRRASQRLTIRGANYNSKFLPARLLFRGSRARLVAPPNPDPYPEKDRADVATPTRDVGTCAKIRHTDVVCERNDLTHKYKSIRLDI